MKLMYLDDEIVIWKKQFNWTDKLYTEFLFSSLLVKDHTK